MTDVPRIRRAGPADTAGLVQSFADLITEDAGGNDPWSNQRWAAEHGEATIVTRLEDPGRLILVLDDGSVAGHLAARIEDPVGMRTVRTATIGSLYVDARVRSQGWGGQLVAAFLDWAAERGAPHATVTAYAANEAAQRFYRAHGFAPLEVVLRRVPS